MIGISSFSLVVNNFPNEKEALIGYMEAFQGIGRVIGLLISSWIYEFFGFAVTFYSVGFFIFLVSLYSKFYL